MIMDSIKILCDEITLEDYIKNIYDKNPDRKISIMGKQSSVNKLLKVKYFNIKDLDPYTHFITGYTNIKGIPYNIDVIVELDDYPSNKELFNENTIVIFMVPDDNGYNQHEYVYKIK